MASFAKKVSRALLPLVLALPGIACVADPAEERTGVAEQADTPTFPKCPDGGTTLLAPPEPYQSYVSGYAPSYATGYAPGYAAGYAPGYAGTRPRGTAMVPAARGGRGPRLHEPRARGRRIRAGLRVRCRVPRRGRVPRRAGVLRRARPTLLRLYGLGRREDTARRGPCRRATA